MHLSMKSLNFDIDELNLLFSQYGEKRLRINSVRSEKSARDLINSFGGMGSLNDVYICKQNGHKIDIEDEIRVNEKVRSLLTSIHKKCLERIS